MEDWTLIRRLVTENVPKARIAARLGISRTTVVKAVASDAPPTYKRKRRRRFVHAVRGEARVRALLDDEPEMPATVIAGRAGWEGSITWFRDNVRRLRREHRRPDPADRLSGAVLNDEQGGEVRVTVEPPLSHCLARRREKAC